jgi:hypothetical protein
VLGGAVHLGHKIPGALESPVGRTGRALDASEIAARASRGGPSKMN